METIKPDAVQSRLKYMLLQASVRGRYMRAQCPKVGDAPAPGPTHTTALPTRKQSFQSETHTAKSLGRCRCVRPACAPASFEDRAQAPAILRLPPCTAVFCAAPPPPRTAPRLRNPPNKRRQLFHRGLSFSPFAFVLRAPQHDREKNTPPGGQAAPSHRVPLGRHAAAGSGEEPAKPAGSFGRTGGSARPNPARGSASSDNGSGGGGGPPRDRGDGAVSEGAHGGAEAGEEADNKELMHVLESTLITWTKQIKNVLKQVWETGSGAAFFL